MKINDLDAKNTFINLKGKFPRAFFFESDSLSIIGLDREESLRLVGTRTLSFRAGLSEELDGHFLDHLSKKLEALSTLENRFPYEHGGAFGTLGYEIVGLIEPRLMQSGYFKTLESSDEVLAEVFFSKDLIIFEHGSDLIHFTSSASSVELHDFRKASIQEASLLIDEDFGALDSHMGEMPFLENVKKIKSHIDAGDIFQAVLSERFELPVNAHPLAIFSSVKGRCKSAYSFYFDFKESSFFGASPETLVRIKGTTLETHPIAGTRPRSADKKTDAQLERQLKRSVKEGAEHLMLVDLARNDLGRVSKPGSISVDVFRRVLKLSNVMHLISIVKGEKQPQKTDLEVLGACFPAGTLSGAPKVRAMEILSQLETRPRGFYGGAVVAFDHAGGLDSCIAIRSVEVKDQRAILRAGAGIVADSNPKKEYLEIKHKLNALLSAVKASEKKVLKTTVIA